MKPAPLKEDYFLEKEARGPALPSEQGETTEQSRIISAQFEKILDSLPFYVILVDSHHNIQFANHAVRQNLGVTLEQVQGHYCPKVVHGVDGHYHGCPVEQAIKGGPTEKEFFAVEHGRWLLTSAYPTGAKTKEGLDLYFHTVRDITHQKEAQKALEVSENKYRRLFEELEDAIFVMSSDGLVQDMNRAGLELFQIPSLDGVPDFNLLTDLSLVDSEWDPFMDALEHHKRVVNHEITFRRPGGKVAVVSINATMEREGKNGDGVIRGIARDLTRHRQLEQQSITDELTTLYNRTFFDACLVSKVKHAQDDRRTSLSVLFLDIDDFKAYNDAYGHQEGDYLMHKIAQAMLTALRGGDVAARYGGEEFTIIVPCGPRLAAQVAERVRAAVEQLCSMDNDERIKRDVTASVGVASLGMDAKTAEKLVNVADKRMYEAKRLGKNRVSVGEASAAQRPTRRA